MARIPYPATTHPALTLLPAPLNVFRMMSHAEPLLRPFVELALSNLGAATLSPRLRELVILTVARTCRCSYIRVQHVPIALDAGVSPAELNALAEEDLDLSGYSEAEATALSATVEMLAEHTWSPATVATLGRHYSDRQIVELGISIGIYTMLSGIMNGLDIDIDPAGERFNELANRR